LRILFIAPYVPSLIRVRPYQFIRALNALGHEITVAALGADGEQADRESVEALRPYCHAIHLFPLSKKQAALRCALHLPTPIPLWSAYCFSPAMEDFLQKLSLEKSYDVAHIEHLRAAHFASVLKNRLPLVFDAVDCITELRSQLMRSPGQGTLGRIVSWEEYIKLRRYEPRMTSLFERTLITSELDAANLQKLGQRQGMRLLIDVIPNGVDLDYFYPMQDLETRPGSIVFSGKMSYAANRDAALHFCADIFPVIRRQYPGATLTVAGSGPTADLLTIANRQNSGIEVTGRVPDLRPYLARAAVAVCPLRVGVGIQNKVLEAMAMGKAVVATPLAARPLQPTAPGESLCVADTPLSFATQILHLLQNPQEAARLGTSARHYVETWHNWQALACRLTALYEDAISAF
jgi:sugar transferase (PEP-CTERM/EpsH1 system associated)